MGGTNPPYRHDFMTDFSESRKARRAVALSLISRAWGFYGCRDRCDRSC